MSSYRRWTLCVAGVVCGGVIAAVWAPAMAVATPPAPSSSSKWAVVSDKGALLRTNGATSATRMSKGRYLVQFSSSMSKCAFVGSADEPTTGAEPAPTELTVGQVAGKPKAVFVQTFEQLKGKLFDMPFDLTTYCGTDPIDAVIGIDGSIARGSHVVSATHPATGRYDVVFDHDVHDCTFTATIGSAIPDEVLIPGLISVAGLLGNNDGVLVRTSSRSNVDTDFPFHLAVNCGAAATSTAVVNADGTPVRGTNLVSSARFTGIDHGAYEVVFNRNVRACSFTATVGAPDSAGPVLEPVTISATNGFKNAEAVFVLVQFMNGAPRDDPFHLTVTC